MFYEKVILTIVVKIFLTENQLISKILIKKFRKHLADNGIGYNFATAFEKESTPDDGEGDKEERSLRKLIETAKRYKGKGVTVYRDDHQFRR